MIKIAFVDLLHLYNDHHGIYALKYNQVIKFPCPS